MSCCDRLLRHAVTFYCDKKAVAILEDRKRDKVLYLRLRQPMRRTLKTILLLRQAVREWVNAVNANGSFGTWGFKVLDDPKNLFEVVR